MRQCMGFSNVGRQFWWSVLASINFFVPSSIPVQGGAVSLPRLHVRNGQSVLVPTRAALQPSHLQALRATPPEDS